MKVIDFISWLMANKAQLVLFVASIVGAARAVVYALEALAIAADKLVVFMINVFPSLKPIDGKIHWFIGVLDGFGKAFSGLSKSPVLNGVSLNRPLPKPPVQVETAKLPSTPLIPPVIAPVVKAFILALCVGALLPAPARAADPCDTLQVMSRTAQDSVDAACPGYVHTEKEAATGSTGGLLWSSGPTLPLMEVRPGNPHPVSLAPGAGYQLNLTWIGAQKAIFGRSWDMLSFNAMAFGSDISTASGQSMGALSIAGGPCILSSLLCAGVGHDLVTSNGTLGKWFFVFALSFNFGSVPSAPPVGVETGPLGLPRANTLYFGSP